MCFGLVSVFMNVLSGFLWESAKLQRQKSQQNRERIEAMLQQRVETLMATHLADLLWHLSQPGAVFHYACSKAGTLLLQAVLRRVSWQETSCLALGMRYAIRDLVVSRHGVHAIKCFIEVLSQDDVPKEVQELVGTCIAQELHGCIHEMAKHQLGSRVLHLLITRWHCVEQVEVVVNTMLERVAELIPDHYGHYPIQAVLARGTSEQRGKIFTTIIQHLPRFAYNWSASYVVKDVFELGAAHQQEELARAFLSLSSNKLAHIACQSEKGTTWGADLVLAFLKFLTPKQLQVAASQWASSVEASGRELPSWRRGAMKSKVFKAIPLHFEKHLVQM